MFPTICRKGLNTFTSYVANVERPMLNVPNTSFIFRHFERLALPLLLTLEGSICVAISVQLRTGSFLFTRAVVAP